MSDPVNTLGRTPEQSNIEAGTITVVLHVTGKGKRKTLYRVQYNSMYFKYPTLYKANVALNAWIENGRGK